jgi:hypothetical protein
MRKQMNLAVTLFILKHIHFFCNKHIKYHAKSKEIDNQSCSLYIIQKNWEYKYMITVEDIAGNVLVVLCKLLMISKSA